MQGSYNLNTNKDLLSSLPSKILGQIQRWWNWKKGEKMTHAPSVITIDK